ncbi:hypothetical protein BT63DRAFT_456095 [Microthyrium microscopicum]|uniref:Cyclin-dependent kinase n=1 Tax=Microthyrium microscopicum TaxID=703497 RepID=A0A6A6UBZ7_9PEZI|nr:hypothetical protein BT63DRAFT_456095 [Microthyrium microscopicum]
MAEQPASAPALAAAHIKESSPYSSQSSPPQLQVPSLIKTSSSVSTTTIDTEALSPLLVEEQGFLSDSSQPLHRPVILRESSSSSDATGSDDSAFTDPASLNKGSKRTASGTVKPPSPTRAVPPTERSETVKKDLKVGELSSKLRTRLKYAMMKVQNGWEGQSLDQVEQLSQSQLSSPASPASAFTRRGSISSDAYILSPMPRTSPTHLSQILQHHIQSPPFPDSPHHNSNAWPSPLAPAAQIISPKRNSRRSSGSRFPPVLSRSGFSAEARRHNGPMSPVRLDPSFQSPSLQNQAEKDAVETLLFMSSPNNSSNMKNGSSRSPGGRAKRVEFSPRVEWN